MDIIFHGHDDWLLRPRDRVRVFWRVAASSSLRCLLFLPLRFMDFDFRCNRLSCRKSLTEKAVVVRRWQAEQSPALMR